MKSKAIRILRWHVRVLRYALAVVVVTDIVAAVVLPPGGTVGPGRGPSVALRQPLPMPRLAVESRSMPTVIYRVAAIDFKGRVNDLSVPRAIGWDANTRWICGKPVVSWLSPPAYRAFSA